MSDAAKIISNKIDDIIRNRKIKAEDIKKKRDVFYEIRNLINTEKALNLSANSILDEKIKIECKRAIAKAAFPLELRKELDKIIAFYDTAVARFQRDSINIATVGMARQGKSMFLQAISNLDNDIIPVSDADDCTGAVSIIHNDPGMGEGKVRVKLTFRTKEESLKIVRDYIKVIDPSYLEENDITFDNIECLPVDSFFVEEGELKKSTALKHLTKIVEAFRGTGIGATESIKDLYGHAEMELSDPQIIKKYVAQHNGLGENDPEREYYYSWLAVSKAEIYCKFREDVGKLVLLDTIGLGDTKLGIEDAMLDTVGNKCDAAVVVRKPITGITEQDTELYTKLKDSFAKRNTKKWLFYIANHHKGNNDNAVDSYYKAIEKGNMNIASVHKIDCSNKEQVQDDFLIPTLNTLTANMDEIDRAYLKELEESVEAFKEKFKNYIDNMPQLNSSLGSASVATYQMGVECYQKLTSDLSQKVTEWYRKRNMPNAVLWSQIKDILDNLENVLPSEDEIQNVMSRAGNLIGDDIWKVPLNYVRNKITDQFIAIDKPMEEETLNFKNDIVEELYNTLKSLAGEDEKGPEDNDYVKWLWNVLEPHIKDKPEFSQIYRALQFLDRFEFNVRAQIILEVRNQLGIINPMTPDVYMKPNFNFSKINAGKEIKFFMTSRIAILEDGLRYALSKLNRLPNQAFYAAAEEVYDRLTFSSDLENGNFVDMSTVWGNFFMQFGPVIFQNALSKYQQLNDIMQKYNDFNQAMRDVLSKI